MEGIKSPVIQPLIRITGKTTSWASLSCHSDNDLISDDPGRPLVDINACESLPPLHFLSGCDYSFQKTVVYENGLRFVRKNCGSENFTDDPFDSIRRAHSTSGDSGMFVDMDKRSDRTNECALSMCSDLGMDDQLEPPYSVPACVRPVEPLAAKIEPTEVLSVDSESVKSESPIYMELEPPTTVHDFPKLVSLRRTSVRKVPKNTSTAERRMRMSVEKTNREVFEKPCTIRMVYRRHSQRRLMSQKRVVRLVPRLSQLCVQVLINEVVSY